MTFLALRKLALSRAGDRAFFRGGPSTTIAHVDQVNIELNAAYEYLVNLLALHHYFHVLTYEDVTWPADTRELDLESELTAVPREVVGVWAYGSGGTSTLPTPVFVRGDHRSISTTRGGGRRIGGCEASAYYMEGNTLGRNSLLSEATTIHVGFAPLVETMAADGDVPAQAPANLHQAIAHRAAWVLIGSVNGAPQLVAEEMNRWEYMVERWATQRRTRLGMRLSGFAARKQ